MGSLIATEVNKRKIIEKEGVFNRITTPGITFLACYEKKVGSISTLPQSMRFRCTTRTKNEVEMILKITLKYQITTDRICEAYYMLPDPKDRFRVHIFDYFKLELKRIDDNEFTILQSDLEEELMEILNENMFRYGYEVIQLKARPQSRPHSTTKESITSSQESILCSSRRNNLSY